MKEKPSRAGNKKNFTHCAVVSSTEKRVGRSNVTGKISLGRSRGTSYNSFVRSIKADAAALDLGIPDRSMQSERSVRVLVVYQKLRIRTD